MKTIILRLLLVLVAVAAGAAAARYIHAWDLRAASLRQSQQAFDEEAARLQVTLADLRASQAAYLAADQDLAFWTARTTTLRQQAEGQLARLASNVSTAGIEGDLAAAAESLAAFGRFDGRVRELLRDGQPATATSLVFSDSAQLTIAASNGVAAARGTRARTTGTEIAGLERLELNAAAGAGAVILLVLLLLVPGVRHRGASAQAATSETPAAETSQIPSPAPRVIPAAIDEFRKAPAAREEAPAALAAAVRAEGGEPTMAGVDLLAAARLCTDFAKVSDTSELPALLARAAAVLDASGIVVWIGGDQGDLLPAFSYGYTQQALSRMQSLPRDGGTAVSVAFRKAAMEVVPAEDQISGAIVAPIVTSNGCVGVMAVEIPPGAETSAGVQAVSNIIAAQLATLIPGEAA